MTEEQSPISFVAIVISFIILLEINIFIMKRVKPKYMALKETAKAKGNYVLGKAVKSHYYSPWTDSDGSQRGNTTKVIYEYTVNGY